MILIQQIKAARGLLEWSQDELGERAGLSKTAITNIESGRYRPKSESLMSIKNACELAGVEFIEGGVKFSLSKIHTIKNPNFEQKMRDFIYETCKNQNIRHIDFFGINPRALPPDQAQLAREHIERMGKLGVTSRVIISDKIDPKDFLHSLNVRTMPDQYHVHTSPLFVFGTYTGMILYDVQEVVIIINKNQALFQKQLFEFVWAHSKPLQI